MASAQLKMFGTNIYFLVGLLFALAILIVLGVLAWTALKVALAEARRKRSLAEYRRRTFREDGTPFPRSSPGVCGECGLGHDTIYRALTGESLCPECYDRFWRREAAESIGQTHPT